MTRTTMMMCVALVAAGCGNAGKATMDASMGGGDDLATAGDAATEPDDLSQSDAAVAPDMAQPIYLVGNKATLDLGDVRIAEKGMGAVRITNSGPTTVGPLSIAVTGDNSEIYLELADGDCEDGVTTLAAGAYCDVTMTFRPQAVGPRSQTLTVSAASAGTVTATVIGNGTDNAVLRAAITPSATLPALINRESKTVQIRVTNMGTIASGPLTPSLDNPISDLQLAPSTTSATPCTAGITLAAAAYCDYELVFTPTSGYTLNTAFRVSSTFGAPGAAGFSAQALWPIDITKSGSGTGSVKVGNTIACDDSCTTATVGRADGTTVGVSQIAAAGSLPGGFSGDCTTSTRSCNFIGLHGPLSLTAIFNPFDANVVFVTDGTYAATLGDVSNYDAICNTIAATAGLEASGGDDFIAWMSSSTSNAIDRLKAKLAPSAMEPRGFILVDGTPVADDLTSWLGSSNRMFNSINKGPLGNVPFQLPWTGTNPDGTVATGKNCVDWTSTTPVTTQIGHTYGGPLFWTNVNGSCSETHSLYCLMRTKVKTIAPVAPASARRIWISGTGSVTMPDARCQAAVPAGVNPAKVKALVARTTGSGASLLDSAATYVRPDGAIVGTGAQIAALAGMTTLLSGTWQLADGTYVTDPNFGNPQVFTGSTAIGSAGAADTTCNDWTDATTGTARSGWGVVRYQEWWSYGTMPCTTTTARFYCIETP